MSCVMCEQERSWLQWFLSYEGRGWSGKRQTLDGKLLNCLFSDANKLKTPNFNLTKKFSFALKKFTSQCLRSLEIKWEASAKCYVWGDEWILLNLINFRKTFDVIGQHLTDGISDFSCGYANFMLIRIFVYVEEFPQRFVSHGSWLSQCFKLHFFLQK